MFTYRKVWTSKEKHGASVASSSPLFATRRCVDLIYFFTSEVSPKQTETNQVKGKFYDKKIKYINQILCRCVVLDNVTAGRGTVPFIHSPLTEPPFSSPLHPVFSTAHRCGHSVAQIIRGCTALPKQRETRGFLSVSASCSPQQRDFL